MKNWRTDRWTTLCNKKVVIKLNCTSWPWTGARSSYSRVVDDCPTAGQQNAAARTETRPRRVEPTRWCSGCTGRRRGSRARTATAAVVADDDDALRLLHSFIHSFIHSIDRLIHLLIYLIIHLLFIRWSKISWLKIATTRAEWSYSTQNGGDWCLRQASRSNFGLMWPSLLNFWPPKLFHILARETAYADLRWNRVIRFQNIAFISLVTNRQAEGRTNKSRTLCFRQL